MNTVHKVLKAVTIVESLLLSIILFSIEIFPALLQGFYVNSLYISNYDNRKGN